jgi:UDP-N-acetylmuramate dehydrogenase
VGGPARYFLEARDEATVLDAVAWAQQRSVPLRVLGGGSNLVVADEGVDGLVLRIALRGVSSRERGAVVELSAAAGEPWDDLVRYAVERGWAGLECLSGIPGSAGATPIQNVGAYGQEVSDVITQVRAFDRGREAIVTLTAADCRFAYRDSRLKSGEPERYVVLAVSYGLAPGAAPRIAYAELQRHLDARGLSCPSLADVRASVLAIRREKSMILDAADPNWRSCGSFFLNPIVTPQTFVTVEARAAGQGMPRWVQPDGRVKLSAAWLIEHAGFARGQRDGAVGLSTRHSLAIVCHEGARAADVIAFADRIAEQVSERFGVRLTREPAVWARSLA